jgi:hypothetical protein
MVVYRVCKKDEFDCIINGITFNKLGTYYDFDTSKLNTHNYVENENYLHFFKDVGSVVFLGELKDNYLCYYDIPDDVLEQYKGTGFYNQPGLIYRKFNLDEYAIPSKLLKSEYIIGIDRIKIEIEWEDYIDDPSMQDYVEVEYYQGEDKKLVKV